MRLIGAGIGLWLAGIANAWAAELDLAPIISGEVLHANTVEYGMLNFRDVVARPEFHGQQLLFDRCQGKAYGGMVYGSLRIDLPLRAPSALPGAQTPEPPTFYQAHFELAKLDLATLLRQLGGNASDLTGDINGEVDFSLTSNHPEAMTGRGHVTITNGSLVQLPILANLLVGDLNGAKGKDQFEARFELGDGKLTVLFARLDSPSAQISISGHIGFDGELHLQLDPFFANKLTNTISFGVLPLLLNPITRRAGRFIVRGQITHPVLVSDPFGSGIK